MAAQKHEKTAVGRKFSLLDIRQKLLTKQMGLMRLHSDFEISIMNEDDILEMVSKIAPSAIREFESRDLQTMQKLLKVCQRKRSLWVWSDHSAVLRWVSIDCCRGSV